MNAVKIISGTLFLAIISCTPADNTEADPDCTDECCSSVADSVSDKSEITCPDCGFKSMETLPSDVCVIKYDCKKCGEELTPADGDCCVYCTYGTHKCPSKQ